MTSAGGPPDEDLAPVSVRLGQVVPPEDPEDWTRPLTWMAAAGMLAAPLVALAWFTVARPTTSEPSPGTWLVAIALVAGAAAAGATQIGAIRALAGTLVAGVFAGLVTVAASVVIAGERQVGSASPTVAHAVVAVLAGMAGAAAAATLAALLAPRARRLLRWLLPAVTGAVTATLVVALVASICARRRALPARRVRARVAGGGRIDGSAAECPRGGTRWRLATAQCAAPETFQRLRRRYVFLETQARSELGAHTPSRVRPGSCG